MESTTTAIIIILVIVRTVVEIVFTAVCSRSDLRVRGLDHLSFTATVLTELNVAFFILLILARVLQRVRLSSIQADGHKDAEQTVNARKNS